ncbi:MAG TPA: PSD1 and planctomycete cytochrome C domain-containing protein [Candidatus Sulfopaludibacter sp.]|jgi:mono/diheme cytochrome c family protein|nr:PSD1 and planctomycete cytochrome C domain-containing protein [Candidatus Sulfopaludibacter sp.]
MLRWGCQAAFFLCALSLSAAEVRYATDVAPLLQKRCYGCHGAGQQMSGLRLDQKDAAMRVIQPGNSANSKLIRMVTGADGKIMPPAGPKLSAAEIATLRTWIDSGAEWGAVPTMTASSAATHWSFRKIAHPAPPAVPAVNGAAWPRNAIDNFILARLVKEGIQPSPEADRATLFRRVNLDLTGLPPTPQEIDDFLHDTRPDAYERAVDRLLASPHYGEKWARYWLDLARYADSDGYEKDRSRPWAWRYREWVIQALNSDMPYDEFTTEQLAGDLMPNRNLNTLVATGFNRNTLTNREGGTDPEQFRDEQVLDRAATLGTVWLGLTVGCAQCHDHKFDPIKQKEFYQLSAYFNTQEEINILAPMPGELGPYLAAKPAYDQKRKELLEQYKIPEALAAYEERLRNAALHPGQLQDADFAYGEFTHTVDNARKVLFMDPAKRSEVQTTAMTDVFIGSCGNAYPKDYCNGLKLGELRTKLNQLNATLPPVTYAPVLLENDTPPKTFVHIKGDWKDPGAEVKTGMLAVLPPMPPGAPTRLTLARWLVSPENPLTSRVAVNRLWQELMGRGIVVTSEDFGTQGEPPSHPELLDWLASEYMARGWSSKQMIRLMVTSATYRQSSHARPELDSKDPSNTLLSHMSRLRLPAELVRDQALSASGLIDLRVGGRSVKPAQPKGVAELSYAGSVKWEESPGADRYRRGLYIHFQRTTPYPQLMNFDAPAANLSCTRRERTDTPLQALDLMNDPVFYEAAQALAFRIMRESTGAFRDRLNYAFKITVGREPQAREAERMGKYYDEALHGIQAAPQTMAALFPNRLEGVPQNEAAAWVELSRVLLNLDEFITRE